MRFRSSPLIAALGLGLAPMLVASNDARACGGCITAPTQTESTLVTGHRMAFALSPTHTVLWDQIQYSGDPAAFAWVLPIKPGARIEASTDAWFESLEAATSARVVSPPVNCGSSGGGCSLGCGASSAFAGEGDQLGAPPPVTVVHEGTVGPYATATLHTTVPGALTTWLTTNGFAIDPAIQPVVDAYVNEGFDFIALRLQPDKGVKQMKPVRVVSPGMSPTLPLRMVAAGTGANVDITLYVIGEGVWVPQNFPIGAVDERSLVWDFKTSSSNYGAKRAALLAQEQGRTWNHAFSMKGALLTPILSRADGSTVLYQVGATSAQTVAEAYIEQGISNGEGTDRSCESAFASLADSSSEVVADLCGGGSASSSSASGSGGANDGSSSASGSGGASGTSSSASGSGGASGTSSSGAGGGSSATSGAGGSGTGSSGTGASSATSASSGTGAGVTPLPCSTDGAIDAQVFACGGLDDLAVALEGLHPRDVTLTRLESSLPRKALGTDLILQAAADQSDLSNWFLTQSSVGPFVCPGAGVAVIGGGEGGGKGPWNRNRWALFATLLAAILATLGRRAARPSNPLARSIR